MGGNFNLICCSFTLGELKWSAKREKWAIDNDSSYSFFREDHRVLSNSNGIKWQNLINRLFRAFGINTDSLVWLDLVESRKLNSFVVQKISHAYKTVTRQTEQAEAMREFGTRYRYEFFRIFSNSRFLSLFQGANLLNILTGAFGANCFFMTEGETFSILFVNTRTGVIKLTFVEARNLPTLDLLGLIQPNPYCIASLKGCDSMLETWWAKPQVIPHVYRTPHPEFNKTVDVYVTSRHIEILEINVMNKHEKTNLTDEMLGVCNVELDMLEPNKEVDVWLPLIAKLKVDDLTTSTAVEQGMLSKSAKPGLRVKMMYVPHVAKEKTRNENETEVEIDIEDDDHE
jgi:hypothetical protein